MVKLGWSFNLIISYRIDVLSNLRTEEESKMCQLNFALLRDDDVAMFYRQFDWFFGPRS